MIPSVIGECAPSDHTDLRRNAALEGWRRWFLLHEISLISIRELGGNLFCFDSEINICFLVMIDATSKLINARRNRHKSSFTLTQPIVWDKDQTPGAESLPLS
jgi:hypothetical protein